MKLDVGEFQYEPRENTEAVAERLSEYLSERLHVTGRYDERLHRLLAFLRANPQVLDGELACPKASWHCFPKIAVPAHDESPSRNYRPGEILISTTVWGRW
jgi:hypothetical protein